MCALASALLLAACGGGSDPAASADTAITTELAVPTAVELAARPPANAGLSAIEQLGKQIFDDANLSEPPGTPCVACHRPELGWADNHGSKIGVAHGSKAASLGLRNTLTNGYSALVPPFAFVTVNGETEARGGHFWDGRADTLAQQALGPLLNPLEMNNASAKAVVDKLAAATYAPQFLQQFGATALNNTDQAFTQIGLALEAFGKSRPVQPFNSKYDAMRQGRAIFDAREQRGMALFMDKQRANCASCHRMNPTSANGADSPFSDFGYYATGIPRNQAIPRNADAGFFDLGLCGPERTAPAVPAGVNIAEQCGKFRVPTLRNVALRQAFMHNGYFKDLNEVVAFYSTRNSNPVHWYGAAGVANDLPADYLGNIVANQPPFNRKKSDGPLLSSAQIADILAFLNTLNDGFIPPR
jgi:cytochrome c peroxidase